MKNLTAGLLLLSLPVGITFFIAIANIYINLDGLTTVDINLFTFQWMTVYHVMWFICAIIIGTFYLYVIFIKGSCLSILGIPIHMAMFVLAWFLWLFLNGPLDRFDTLEIEDTSYHLIQTSANATGQLYLFTCDEHICDVTYIDYVDSSKFFDAEMTYSPSNHTIYVSADAGYGIEEYIIPLDEN